MPAPYQFGAQARIIGEIHGQQTVNVLHFGTNTAINDQSQLDTLLLQLAEALLECVLTTLLPGVTQDWKAVKCDARRIVPAPSDPIVATAPAQSVGALSATSASFVATLLQLRSGSGGRSGRGRIYLPPAGEAETVQSAIDGPTLTLITQFALCVAGKFMGATPTSDWNLIVLSKHTMGNNTANFNISHRDVVSLNPVSDVAVMSSRRKGRGA